jgi:hypothetical protein
MVVGEGKERVMGNKTTRPFIADLVAPHGHDPTR